MNKLNEVLDDADDDDGYGGYYSGTWRKELTQWCVQRQIGGMQGRPNKVEDTCYSYWIGGTLKLLGSSSFDLLDHDALRTFVLSCQSAMGGFSKTRNAFPDMLHSFYSLSYLNLSNHQSSFLLLQDDDNNNNDNDTKQSQIIPLKEMNCTLGIGMETAAKFGPRDNPVP
jgi:prenyltransferase beta subunit